MLVMPTSSSRPIAARGATLGELRSLLQGELSKGDGVRVRGVQQDSRRVEVGDLFVALAGEHADGASFITAAVERGAVAVMRERGQPLAAGVPVLYVDGVRRALARAAAHIYGRPTERLRVVGITGTNGKTTTAHLLATCLCGAGARPAIVGTLGSRFEDWQAPSSLTSPEADELQRLAATVLARGATHLVMEVSSIALEAERVTGVDFDVAVFTNLTQDHLDYHKTMAAYAAAKERLFVEHRPRVAVIHVGDPFGAELADRLERTSCRVLRVSSQPLESEGELVFAREARSAASFEVAMPGRESLHLETPLLGRHNVDNVLCALGAVEALGLDVDAAAASLHTVTQVPGRLERVSSAADDVSAFVDYAHTPDALERVLESLAAELDGNVWCVFGCGGDRDPLKRAPMGEVVGRLADHAVVTNDNPRSENPEAIARAIIVGLARAGVDKPRVELDRQKAIEGAVLDAAPGDVILVAGKGHESYQILGDRVIDFDDRVVLRQALERRRAVVAQPTREER
jgi:UDP-N-acetylmuramoyl-L-alanyl-D-glutamate--2,6-diaminopimelate ligase